MPDKMPDLQAKPEVSTILDCALSLHEMSARIQIKIRCAWTSWGGGLPILGIACHER
jgi:hypothetical protein